MSNQEEIATLGGGCFWCLEAVYEQVKGVTSVKSGYTGGLQADPTYEQVCSGSTGHAEVIQVTFAPSIITFRELLQIFFSIHDPTTLNRQGNDIGTQYRSSIFYASEEQQATAESVVAEIEASQVFANPVVTEVSPLEQYYPAGQYHEEYYRRNSSEPYCQLIIDPKVAKFRSQHFDKLKKSSVED